MTQGPLAVHFYDAEVAWYCDRSYPCGGGVDGIWIPLPRIPIEEGMLKKKIVFFIMRTGRFPMRCKTEPQQPVLKVFFAGFSMDFMVDFPGHSRKSMVQTPPKKTSFFSHVLAWTFDAPNLPFAHSQDGYHGHARSVGNPTTAREIPLLRPREPRACSW